MSILRDYEPAYLQRSRPWWIYDRVCVVELNGTQCSTALLAELRRLDDLRELQLTQASLSAADLEAIARLSSLQTVILDRCTFPSTALPELARLRDLRRLELHGTPPSDADVSSLGRLQTVNEIVCTGSGITLTGREQLQKLLPHTKIK
jgi:hypothetical protein